MELIRTWILSITACAILLGAAEALMPDGGVKRAGKLTGGLILMICLLKPLIGLDPQALLEMTDTLSTNAIEEEQLETAASEPLKKLIEGELSSYIVDKATEIGADCRAKVVCPVGEAGVPIPQSVEVTGALSPEQRRILSQYISEELGIPEAEQNFGSGGAS